MDKVLKKKEPILRGCLQLTQKVSVAKTTVDKTKLSQIASATETAKTIAPWPAMASIVIQYLWLIINQLSMQTMQTKPRYQTARVRLHCTPSWMKTWDHQLCPYWCLSAWPEYPSLYSRPNDPVLRYPGKIIYSNFQLKPKLGKLKTPSSGTKLRKSH